jgi:hypothetical protein
MSRPFKKRNKKNRYQFGSLRQELEEHVHCHGEAWIDALGDLGRPLQQWVDGVIDSFGGETRITPQKKSAIILAAKSLLICEAVDRYLFSLPSIINRSRREVFSIVLQRKELVNAFGRQLADIGMNKLEAESDSLMENLREKYAKNVAQEFTALPPPPANADTPTTQ